MRRGGRLPRSAMVGGMSKSDGALNSYLRKVAQVPLLTPNEEIELGRRIRNGDAAARERMIHANLRLVVTIAREYVNGDKSRQGVVASTVDLFRDGARW